MYEYIQMNQTFLLAGFTTSTSSSYLFKAKNDSKYKCTECIINQTGLWVATDSQQGVR